MTAPGELLELMHTSVRCWNTLQASGREWRHPVRYRRAWARALRPDSVQMVAAFNNAEEQLEPKEEKEFWRLWLAQPDKTRAEFTVEDDSITAVTVGDTWWSWSAGGEVTTNQGNPHHQHGTGAGKALIDPSSILPAVELVVTGRTTFIGRPALEVLARPSRIDENDEESGSWRHAGYGLGIGADERSLLLDAERGVLLRSEARIGGEPFYVIEMETVVFDEELDKDVFTPPPDRAIEPARVCRQMSLSELSEESAFTVLVPEHPPFPLDYARIDPPDPRHEISEQIHIAYGSDFFGDDRELWLVESADPLPQRAVKWREIGAMRCGEDRNVEPPLRIVELERNGTHVHVRSYNLEIEELLDVARSIVPLPSGPPPLRAVSAF